MESETPAAAVDVEDADDDSVEIAFLDDDDDDDESDGGGDVDGRLRRGLSGFCPRSWAARPILFVGGLHRSGTTIFTSLVNESPLVAGFHDTDAPEDEGQHLQDIVPTDESFGGVGRFALEEAFRSGRHGGDARRHLNVKKEPRAVVARPDIRRTRAETGRERRLS